MWNLQMIRTIHSNHTLYGQRYKSLEMAIMELKELVFSFKNDNQKVLWFDRITLNVPSYLSW